MSGFPKSLQRLMNELAKLPTIGEKTAARLAYHLVNNDKKLALSLGEVMKHAVETIRLCERCFHLTEEPLCSVCSNPNREQGLLCVVEKPMDLLAIERTGRFQGLYHVIHGVWAPLRGKGPESMRIAELLERVKGSAITEVIIATSSTVEGDATALYLAKLLSALGIKSTRLAQGMPKGGELEYADDVTLSRALQGRSVIGGN